MVTTEEISLRVGGTYIVRLKGLATAGYTWGYRVDSPENVVSITNEVTLSSVELPAVGANADGLFSVEALAPGTVTIHFEQRRPWQKELPPVDVYLLKVRVEA